MILKCYQQLAVFIFGLGLDGKDIESGLCVAIDGGSIIETKYVVDLDGAHFCVERSVKYIIVSRSCLCDLILNSWPKNIRTSDGSFSDNNI